MTQWRSAAIATMMLAAQAVATTPPQAIRVVGDGVPEPVADRGDAARGRALIVKREAANCVLCHAVPEPAVRFSGNVGPSLAGVASRLSVAQLRLRVADNMRVNPNTVMPSYYKIDGLDRVATQYSGKPVLSAQEVEDVVAWLGTLQ